MAPTKILNVTNDETDNTVLNASWFVTRLVLAGAAFLSFAMFLPNYVVH